MSDSFFSNTPIEHPQYNKNQVEGIFLHSVEEYTSKGGVDIHIDKSVFSKLIELLPVIQETSLECLQRELELYKHDKNRILMERMSILKFFHFLQRKWTLDIIYILLIQGEIHFNGIKRTLEGISSRTLTDRLSELEKIGIISRTVYQDKPIKVIYSLTEYGKGLAALFVPVLFYGLTNISTATADTR